MTITTVRPGTRTAPVERTPADQNGGIRGGETSCLGELHRGVDSCFEPGFAFFAGSEYLDRRVHEADVSRQLPEETKGRGSLPRNERRARNLAGLQFSSGVHGPREHTLVFRNGYLGITEVEELRVRVRALADSLLDVMPHLVDGDTSRSHPSDPSPLVINRQGNRHRPPCIYGQGGIRTRE
jgi:hypothetical protein